MIFALNRTNVRIPTAFVRVRPLMFGHVFNVPLPSLSQMYLVFVFVLFAENVVSLKIQISPSPMYIYISGEKRKKSKKEEKKS